MPDRNARRRARAMGRLSVTQAALYRTWFGPQSRLVFLREMQAAGWQVGTLRALERRGLVVRLPGRWTRALGSVWRRVGVRNEGGASARAGEGASRL